MGRSSTSLAAAMALVLMICSLSGTDAALRIRNDLKEGDVTVSQLPGCCSNCVPTKDIFCPAVCMPCRSVTVAKGAVATVNERVGPYPLESLTVHVLGKSVDVVGTKLFTSTALFVVGPGTKCGSQKNGVEAFIFDGKAKIPAYLCLV